MLSHKELQSDQGFLVYVTRNYSAMVPYLKGFHLTIKMWRGNQDYEGWKTPIDVQTTHSLTIGLLENDASDSTIAPIHNDPDDSDDEPDEDDVVAVHQREQSVDKEKVHTPSAGVTPAIPRSIKDFHAFLELSASDTPPLWQV